MDEPIENVVKMQMCKCGRAPHRPKARNCHFCNRDAQKKYRAALKGPVELAQQIRALSKIGNKEGYVYFFQSGERGLVKIGFSADPTERIRALQTGSPYEIHFIGAVPARQALEKLFHVRFEHIRHQGEWFRPHPDLMDFIKQVCGDNTLAKTYNTRFDGVAFLGR